MKEWSSKETMMKCVNNIFQNMLNNNKMNAKVVHDALKSLFAIARKKAKPTHESKKEGKN